MKQKSSWFQIKTVFNIFLFHLFYTLSNLCLHSKKKYEVENFDQISVQVAKLTWLEEWCGGYLATDTLNQSSWMYSLTQANSRPPVLQNDTY